MTFTYAWANAERSIVRRSDGAVIPGSRGNRDFDAIEDEAAIAAFVPPDPETKKVPQDLDALIAALKDEGIITPAKATALRQRVVR